MIRFLITGTPRSSTKWTAHTLTKIGLWCCHEEAFGGWASDYGDQERWRDTDDGECSWIAAPFSEAVRDAGVPVVGLIRHPMLVAESLVKIGFFHTGQPYLDFIATHTPDVFTYTDETPINKALRFWIDWNQLIECDEWWPVPVNVTRVWAFADRLSVPTHDLVDAWGPPINHKPAWQLSDTQPDPSLLAEAIEWWEKYTA